MVCEREGVEFIPKPGGCGCSKCSAPPAETVSDEPANETEERIARIKRGVLSSHRFLIHERDFDWLVSRLHAAEGQAEESSKNYAAASCRATANREALRALAAALSDLRRIAQLETQLAAATKRADGLQRNLAAEMFRASLEKLTTEIK